MTALILIGLGVLAAWCLSLLRWPFRACLRCGGSGKNPGSNGKHWGFCRRCGGSKQVRRFGTAAVYHVLWSVAGKGVRDRLQKRLEEGRKKAGYPE
jgi:hypothetical protein